MSVNPNSFQVSYLNTFLFGNGNELVADGILGEPKDGKVTRDELEKFRGKLGDKIGMAARAGGADADDVKRYQAADFLLSRFDDLVSLIGDVLTPVGLTAVAARGGNHDILSGVDLLPQQYDRDDLTRMQALIEEMDRDSLKNGEKKKGDPEGQTKAALAILRAKLEPNLETAVSLQGVTALAQQIADLKFMEAHFDYLSRDGRITSDTLAQATERDRNGGGLSELDFTNDVHVTGEGSHVYLNHEGIRNNRVSINGPGSTVDINAPLTDYDIQINGEGLKLEMLEGGTIRVTDTKHRARPDEPYDSYTLQLGETWVNPRKPDEAIVMQNRNAKRIVDTALSELAVTRGNRPGIDVYDDHAYVRNNYTILKDENGNVIANAPWLANPNNPQWCAAFVSAVTYKATGDIPWKFAPSVEQIRDWGKNNGRFISQEAALADEKYLPKPGDPIIYGYGWGPVAATHTGIVEKVYMKNGKWYIDTIEGNTGGPGSGSMVARHVGIPLDKGRIFGFVRAYGDMPSGLKSDGTIR